MSDDLRVRRVVTGHDAQGRAVVTADAVLEVGVRRPGQQGCVVWATDQVPADNLDPEDGARKTDAARLENGATFRVVRYEPGAGGRMHRTQTTDYGVVLSGAVVLELDDGVEVELKAGEVLVQRGTIHRWSNRGPEPCTVAFVVIDALPITAET